MNSDQASGAVVQWLASLPNFRRHADGDRSSPLLFCHCQKENTAVVASEELLAIVFTGSTLERDPPSRRQGVCILDPSPGGWNDSNASKDVLGHDLPRLPCSPRGTGRAETCESMPQVKYGLGFSKSSRGQPGPD